MQSRPLISNLSVSARFRRMGVARQLMVACEVVLEGMGYDHVMLKVEETNKGATKLYQ